MPLKLSSSPLSIKSETLKSPKIGKRNYILKTELSSLKVHTPSVNQNENPLFNYYNFSSSSEQNCNTILNIDEPHSYDYKEENVYNSQSNNQTNDSSGKNFYKDESDGSFEEIILNARELASEQNGCRLLRRVSFGNRILAKLMSLHKDLCFMLNKPPSIMNYNINNEYNGNVNFNNSNNYSYLNRSIAHSNMNQYK